MVVPPSESVGGEAYIFRTILKFGGTMTSLGSGPLKEQIYHVYGGDSGEGDISLGIELIVLDEEWPLLVGTQQAEK